jgi:4-amino-4-deoxy-L-arabinose transferase-like glycosyltransferase
MQFKITHLALALILVFALLLRIWGLTITPPGFNWDEASVGYSAYSLLKTGHDEFGRSWPIFLESFGDYKTALYSILLVPLIHFLGLSVFSVRVLNSVIGTCLVLAVYFLGKEFFNPTTQNQGLDGAEHNFIKPRVQALLFSFLVAISPLAIHLSRFALEWYAALPIFVMGLTYLLKAMKPNASQWHLSLAAVLFAFSLYWYHSLRLFLPLFLLSFLLIYWQKLIKNKRTLIRSLFLGLVATIPLAFAMHSSDLLARPQSVALFTDSRHQRQLNEQLYRFTAAKIPFRRLLVNKVVYYGQEILVRYINHFSFDFLFFGQDATSRISLYPVGKMQIVALPFLILGFAYLITQRNQRNSLLLVWIALAPLPASLTTDAPHGLRSLLLLPALLLTVVLGLVQIYNFLQTRFSVRLVLGFCAFTAMLFMVDFCRQFSYYWLFYPEAAAADWQAGQKQMVAKLNQYYDQYEQVYVTTSYGQPYIFIAFFNQWDPGWLQQNLVQQESIFNSRAHTLGKISFKSIQAVDYCQPNTLIIDTKLPNKTTLGNKKRLEPLAIIKRHNRWHQDKPAYYFVDSNYVRNQSSWCASPKI